MPSERDLEAFLQQGFGVAFVPQSMLFSNCVKRVPVTGLDLRRNVSLYGVAGRQTHAGCQYDYENAARG
jgi:hypothetical protein